MTIAKLALGAAVASAALAGVSAQLNCDFGMEAPFPCNKIGLFSTMPLAALGCAEGTGSDIWGWTDPDTEEEFALMTCSTGMSIIDVTNPQVPVLRGNIRVVGETGNTLWRDVKVVNDVAYFVADLIGTGITAVDLKRLRTEQFITTSDGTLLPDTTTSHNLAGNEESKRIYATNGCNGEDGILIADVSDPLNPKKIGCIEGYAHDLQCVIYHGPDVEFRGRELCFLFSGDPDVIIVDVTDPDDLEVVHRSQSNAMGFSHQGWLSPDHSFLLAGEEDAAVTAGAIIYIYDTSKIRNVELRNTYQQELVSTDHNIYISRHYAFLSQYGAGLRVIDISDPYGEIPEVAYFDVQPATYDVGASAYHGAWSSYPYFKSGTIVVSSLEGGLFVLSPTRKLFHDGSYDEAFKYLANETGEPEPVEEPVEEQPVEEQPVEEPVDGGAEGESEVAATSASVQTASTQASSSSASTTVPTVIAVAGAAVGVAGAAAAVHFRKQAAHANNKLHIATGSQA